MLRYVLYLTFHACGNVMPAVPKGIDRLTLMVNIAESGSAPSSNSLTEGLGLLIRFRLDPTGMVTPRFSGAALRRISSY
jgi:hypothetical protein